MCPDGPQGGPQAALAGTRVPGPPHVLPAPAACTQLGAARPVTSSQGQSAYCQGGQPSLCALPAASDHRTPSGSAWFTPGGSHSCGAAPHPHFRAEAAAGQTGCGSQSLTAAVSAAALAPRPAANNVPVRIPARAISCGNRSHTGLAFVPGLSCDIRQIKAPLSKVVFWARPPGARVPGRPCPHR